MSNEWINCGNGVEMWEFANAAEQALMSGKAQRLHIVRGKDFHISGDKPTWNFALLDTTGIPPEEVEPRAQALLDPCCLRYGIPKEEEWNWMTGTT